MLVQAFESQHPLHLPAQLTMDRPIPPAPEEVWLARANKRAWTIAHHKTVSQTYTYLCLHDMPRPVTPDPLDRTISKRTWEKKVRRWLLDLMPS